MSAAPVEVIETRGDSRARGEAFGSERAAAIRAWLGAWSRSLIDGGVEDAAAYARQLLRDTDFVPAIEEYAPGLLEELRAMAASARIEHDLLFAAQLMDEEWAYRQERLGAPVVHKCSSAAVLGEGEAHIGQNMDLGAWTDGHQLVHFIAPHGGAPGACVFTMGGMLGLMGVNDRGLGVCVNALPRLPHERSGLPVAFVIRRLLEATSAEQATQWLQDLPHATGQHYLLADASSLRSFEASPRRVAEYRSPYAGCSLHTNHPLAYPDPLVVPGRDETNSQTRLASLVKRLSSGRPGVEDIKAALSSTDDPRHPVCRGGKTAAGLIGFTTGSMVSTLSRGEGGIDTWISAGPPCLRGYRHFRRD